MSRLFTFGCSFTQYIWPTWADILGKSFDWHENWAKIGAGNQYIFNSIIECHLRHQITAQDTVIVMWTNVSREDRYVNHEWLLAGNVFNNHPYGKEFVAKFADIRGYYIRDLAAIWAIDNMLSSINCQYHHLAMVPVAQACQYDGDITDDVGDLLEHYRELTDKFLPSVLEVIFDGDWNNRPFAPTEPTADEIKTAAWQAWYDRVRDPTWPDCDREKDFVRLPQWIQKECKQHGYQKGMFAIPPRLKYSSSRVDPHPTPVEHLEYLEKVLPQYHISEQTQSWCRDLTDKIAEKFWYYQPDLWSDQKRISEIWVPDNLVTRW